MKFSKNKFLSRELLISAIVNVCMHICRCGCGCVLVFEYIHNIP